MHSSIASNHYSPISPCDRKRLQRFTVVDQSAGETQKKAIVGQWLGCLAYVLLPSPLAFQDFEDSYGDTQACATCQQLLTVS